MENRNPRIEIEVSEQTRKDLDELVAGKGWNKTTTINQAVQVYADLTRLMDAGRELFISEPNDSDHLVRMLLDAPADPATADPQ